MNRKTQCLRLLITTCIIVEGNVATGAVDGLSPLSGQADSIGVESGIPCRLTGEPCFQGIDPDVYHMPLFGVSFASGQERLCATTNWSSLPAESFDADFMRFWASQLNASQQAQIEAAGVYFVTTHWGPPAVPPRDLAEVATPGRFAGEMFSSLESRTTRIEFEVPKTDFEKMGWSPNYVPVVIPPDPRPQIPLKLRGWYIKGDGVADDDTGRTEHPLIIFSSGFPYSIAHELPVGGIAVGRQMRKTVTYLVARGFDVLFFDKRGHGYSEGFLEGMGEDIFRALDQLEHGQIVEEGLTLSLTILTPDGRRLRGAAAATEHLLGKGYTARTKPVVLRGFSYGSTQLQKAMAMNYSDLPVEYRFTKDASGCVVIDPARRAAGNRAYNFKGIIAISGFAGSPKYETIPYFLSFDALAFSVGHNGSTLKSSVYRSMDRWPAFLGLYATHDFETADGAVDAFNQRLRGFKEIELVTGYHFGLASEEVDTFFAYESARFAKRVLFKPAPVANFQTTTYAEAVCASERVIMDPATQTILDVPSLRIRNANREVNSLLEKWTRDR
jgi:pimeloyl-ACP methyl ester carboxylesterase